MSAAIAAAPPAAEDTPERFLEEFAAHEFGFEQMKAFVDASVNVHQRLRETRADLRQLKAEWVVHDAKSRFMEELKKDGVLDACTEEQLEALRANRTAAAALRAQKKAIRERSAQLRGVIARVVELYGAFQARSGEFTAAVERRHETAEAVRAAAEEARRRAEGSACFGGSDGELLAMDTDERCQRVLDNQIEAIQSLVEETEAVQAEVAALEQAAGPLDARAAELLARAEAAEGEARARGGQPAAEAAAAAEPAAWYAAVGGLVSRLAGVEAVPREGGEPVLDFRLLGGEQTVSVRYAADGSRFTGAEVAPGGFATDDIVRHAVETQGLEFLVREVAARARCASQRAAHIRRAVAGLPSSQWSRDSPVVTVAFDIGVVCTAFVGFDYPAPHARLAVRSLDGACGWDEEDLARIAAEATAERHADVGAFFDRVQVLLAEQARRYEEA